MLMKAWDSIHFHQATYIVFEEESDVPVKNIQFQRPEAKKWGKLIQMFLNMFFFLCLCFFFVFFSVFLKAGYRIKKKGTSGCTSFRFCLAGEGLAKGVQAAIESFILAPLVAFFCLSLCTCGRL